ncbi:hypothetical protein GCM10009850_075410 [Nonomuraea monospora]|uniref:Uncharacterized protein n=1 Tax=Nonomuraea monospora TaxID=568818 RepID=A0ABN3CRL0_9ACTN
MTARPAHVFICGDPALALREAVYPRLGGERHDDRALTLARDGLVRQQDQGGGVPGAQTRGRAALISSVRKIMRQETRHGR